MSISKIKQLINILLEAEMQSSNTSSNNNEPFGKILFSPQRKDGVDKTEPNTTPEVELKNALSLHYHQLTSKGLGEDAPLILDLINQGKYNDILKPAPGYAYRILSSMPIGSAMNLLGVGQQDIIVNASDKPWIIEKPIVLLPKDSSSNLQSWTYNLLKLDFGTFETGFVEMIFEASVQNNVFFMNPRAAEKLDFLSNFSDEYETISVGPVTCSRVLVYYTTKKNTKSKINVDLLEKYVKLINKKGHEIEDKINKEIMDFYHGHGIFLNVRNAKDLSSILDIKNYSNLDSHTKKTIFDLSDETILLQETVKKQKEFSKFFRDLLTKLEPSLKKDFGLDTNDVISKLGFTNPLSNFVDTHQSFYTAGVNFKELDLNAIKEMSNLHKFDSIKDSIAKILFRAFQRKQKY